MEKTIVVIVVHSVNENQIFFSGRAIKDFTIKDRFVLKDYPNQILEIERLEMYRKDVQEVPEMYGADITIKTPYGIKIQDGDILFKYD